MLRWTVYGVLPVLVVSAWNFLIQDINFIQWFVWISVHDFETNSHLVKVLLFLWPTSYALGIVIEFLLKLKTFFFIQHLLTHWLSGQFLIQNWLSKKFQAEKRKKKIGIIFSAVCIISRLGRDIFKSFAWLTRFKLP